MQCGNGSLWLVKTKAPRLQRSPLRQRLHCEETICELQVLYRWAGICAETSKIWASFLSCILGSVWAHGGLSRAVKGVRLFHGQAKRLLRMQISLLDPYLEGRGLCKRWLNLPHWHEGDEPCVHVASLGAEGQEIYPSSCSSHYWSTPSCVPEQCPITMWDPSSQYAAALIHNGVRLLRSHLLEFLLLFLATFCSLGPPFPG